MYHLDCLCSRQLAEEVLRGGEETGGEEEEEIGSGFEGMEALTRAIETGDRERVVDIVSR